MRSPRVLIYAAGSFAHSHSQILKDDGADVSVLLSNPAAAYGPAAVAPCLSPENPAQWQNALKECDFLLPYSIAWTTTEWGRHAIANDVPVFAPSALGCRLERERDFARELCNRHGVPFPKAHFAANRIEARRIVESSDLPFVIKNPLCAPGSPIHTIVCETREETRAWLNHLNYAEGVFLQEYAGSEEAGHIALVSNGHIHPLVSNQEYKRAHSGDMGIVAAGPLGGIVERDDTDRYGMTAALIEPLLPWFKEVGFHGPVQVTAARMNGEWTVLEYNVRLGVTSGSLILRMLENPTETLLATCRDETIAPRFKPGIDVGASLTVVTNGYPFKRQPGPEFPIIVDGKVDCDLWWNQVQDVKGRLFTAGQRVCDINHVADSVSIAVERIHTNATKVRCSGSYHRTDIGRIKWPPQL